MKKYLTKLQRCSFEGMFCGFSCQTFGYLGYSAKKCRYEHLKKPHFLSSKEMACHLGLGTRGAVQLWAESRRWAEHNYVAGGLHGLGAEQLTPADQGKQPELLRSQRGGGR